MAGPSTMSASTPHGLSPVPLPIPSAIATPAPPAPNRLRPAPVPPRAHARAHRHPAPARINTALPALRRPPGRRSRPVSSWLNLPEYILSRLGGARVAEHTNATHTQLVELDKKQWCREIFQPRRPRSRQRAPSSSAARHRRRQARRPARGLARLRRHHPHRARLPRHRLRHRRHPRPRRRLGLHHLRHLVPRRHAAARNPSARPKRPTTSPTSPPSAASSASTKTSTACGSSASASNSGASAASVVHRSPGRRRRAASLPRQASSTSTTPTCCCPATCRSASTPSAPSAATRAPRRARPTTRPHFASLIFHSLAARYAKVLDRVAAITGKRLKRLFIVGGGSQNRFLNRLTAEATGLEVHRGSPESSTVGNFAVQLAVLEGHHAPTPDLIYRNASALQHAPIR